MNLLLMTAPVAYAFLAYTILAAPRRVEPDNVHLALGNRRRRPASRSKVLGELLSLNTAMLFYVFLVINIGGT